MARAITTSPEPVGQPHSHGPRHCQRSDFQAVGDEAAEVDKENRQRPRGWVLVRPRAPPGFSASAETCAPPASASTPTAGVVRRSTSCRGGASASSSVATGSQQGVGAGVGGVAAMGTRRSLPPPGCLPATWVSPEQGDSSCHLHLRSGRRCARRCAAALSGFRPHSGTS
jgi:hypothetical protein